MADLAMCQDHECPSRTYCLRYTSEPSAMQLYADFGRDEGHHNCGDGWIPLSASVAELQAKQDAVYLGRGEK